MTGRVGYRVTKDLRVDVEGFNLTNRRNSAINYYYASRLLGEAGAVNDVHFHPIEPRSSRVNVTLNVK